MDKIKRQTWKQNLIKTILAYINNIYCGVSEDQGE